MLNAARSTTFYEFDSTDLLKLYREMDERDEEPVVIYHSHTATEAHPSRTDVALAQEPGAHYVLVSTRDGRHLEGAHESGDVEFRSFRIVDGQVTEEEVSVVERYDSATDASTPSTNSQNAAHCWPSKSGSRPFCAPTPATSAPLRAAAPQSSPSSTTSRPGSRASRTAWSRRPVTCAGS